MQLREIIIQAIIKFFLLLKFFFSRCQVLSKPIRQLPRPVRTFRQMVSDIVKFTFPVTRPVGALDDELINQLKGKQMLNELILLNRVPAIRTVGGG